LPREGDRRAADHLLEQCRAADHLLEQSLDPIGLAEQALDRIGLLSLLLGAIPQLADEQCLAGIQRRRDVDPQVHNLQGLSPSSTTAREYSSMRRVV